MNLNFHFRHVSLYVTLVKSIQPWICHQNIHERDRGKGYCIQKVFIHILTLHSTASYQKCIKNPQKLAQPARKEHHMSVTKPISWIQEGSRQQERYIVTKQTLFLLWRTQQITCTSACKPLGCPCMRHNWHILCNRLTQHSAFSASHYMSDKPVIWNSKVKKNLLNY